MATPNRPESETLIDTAVEIAEERRNLLSRVRDRLQTGDDKAALELMREYCGLNRPNDEGRGRERVQ